MLFGHQNDDNSQPAIVGNDVHVGGSPSVNPLAVDPDTGVSLPVAPEDLEHAGNHDAPTLDQPLGDTPTPDPSASSVPADDTPSAPATDDDVSVPSDDLLHPAADDDLLALKQQALQQLSPLVSHLDQSPEEKFRTTMMMIQSSDNQGLVKDAYEAAKQISDDKVRAQALLDIVNEINYFTQQHHED